MFRTASAVLHLLPITGLYVFLPKYLENQFGLANHHASSITGTFGILMMGIGILITGIISVKFSLSARKVSLWIAFTALATACGMLVLSTIGCSMDNFFNGLQQSDSSGVLVERKYSKEFCIKDFNFLAVSEAQKFSFRHVYPTALVIVQRTTQSVQRMASHTSLRATLDVVHSRKMESSQTVRACQVRIWVTKFDIDYKFNLLFSEPEPEFQTGRKGICLSKNCDTKLNIFVAIFALTVFIHSTSEVGGMLIIMRCTDPKDKAMAMGIIQFSIGLLSNIPCPNIYARIIDATCIVWTKICGKNGHCSLYDSDSFRRNFFGEF